MGHTHRSARWPWLLVGVCLIGGSGCASTEEPEAVLARVGDATLTLSELRRFVPRDVLANADRADLLAYANQWIRNELLYRAALEMGYGKDPRVRARIEEMERDLIVNVFLQDELDMEAFISEEEIEAYHRDNQDHFRRGVDEARFMGVWVTDRAMAERVRSAVRGGVTFEDAAADTTVLVADIELGERFYQRGELDRAVAQVVFTLAPGTVSQIVPLEGQFAVLRVEDRQEAGTVRALWEVREDIEARLAADLRESKLQTMLSGLLGTADVSLDVDSTLQSLAEHDPPR